MHNVYIAIVATEYMANIDLHMHHIITMAIKILYPFASTKLVRDFNHVQYDQSDDSICYRHILTSVLLL